MRIEKIDKEGNVIKTFNGVKSAAREAKVSENTVQRQLRGYDDRERKGIKPKTHCGYTWRYANREAEKEAHKKRAIYTLDKDGNKIKRYDSIVEASFATKHSISKISHYLRNKCSRKNFMERYGIGFEYVNDDEKESSLEIKEHGLKGNSNRSKPIYVVDENNRILKEYESARECARESGYTMAQLFNYTSGRTNKEWFKKRYGVGFIYVDEYSKENNLEEETEKNINDEKEIVKPTTQDYYINILVGLVNRTLIEGARYNINGLEFKYCKEDDALINESGARIFRDAYIKIVQIEKPLLNEEERKFLSNLTRAFKDLKGIEKCNDIYQGFEFIRIVASAPVENIDLPKFKEGKYYSELELNRIYTLEELDI